MSRLIEIQLFSMGEDPVFMVTGGVAHIGAVSTVNGSGRVADKAEVLVLPGHREGELAAELAEMAAHFLRRTVAVLVGIHIKNPSRDDIEAIVLEAKQEMNRVLETMERRDCIT
jgi:hypothetical protein